MGSNVVMAHMTRSPYYKAAKIIEPNMIMLHSVGCPQPSAKVFINNWNNEKYTRACITAFIDANTGIVYETMPTNYRAPHCGGKANNYSIGVEMCEPSQIKYTSGSKFVVDPDKMDDAIAAATRTYSSAVDYFASLCKKFNLDPLTQICSHKEAGQKGIASKHADPEHLWTGLGLPYTMDTFRQSVKATMDESRINSSLDEKTDTESEEKKPQTHLYKVSSSVLRIRKGPGTNFHSNGYTGVGVFTITEVRSGQGSEKGWGKLKSGAGWISLDYAKPIS